MQNFAHSAFSEETLSFVDAYQENLSFTSHVDELSLFPQYKKQESPQYSHNEQSLKNVHFEDDWALSLSEFIVDDKSIDMTLNECNSFIKYEAVIQDDNTTTKKKQTLNDQIHEQRKYSHHKQTNVDFESEVSSGAENLAKHFRIPRNLVDCNLSSKEKESFSEIAFKLSNHDKYSEKSLSEFEAFDKFEKKNKKPLEKKVKTAKKIVKSHQKGASNNETSKKFLKSVNKKTKN